MNITLPKRFEMEFRDYPFVYNDNWISNGHFMVKKQVVKDSFKYCSLDEGAQVDCDRIFPTEIDGEWIKTDTLYDNGSLGYLRVFKHLKLNKTICFKEDYIKHFDIQSVRGHSYELNSAYVSDNGNVVLMPCRNFHTDLV